MSSPILPLFASRPFAFALSALLLATASTTFAADAANVTSPTVQSPAAVPAAAKPAEDRDALLARLTKVLKYGSQVIGYKKPGKVDGVLALGLIGDERSVPVLVEHLQNEDNDHLRLQIVRALGWIGSGKAVPALEQALQDKYPHVRRQAAEVLNELTGRSYDYDKTDLPVLNEFESASGEGVRRLDKIAEEVTKRRELRQVLGSGSNTPLKQKLTEPIDIDASNLSVGTLAKIYSDLTGKLVLTSPKISAITLSCKIEKATRAEAQVALQKALKEAGVQVVELERGVVALVPASSGDTAEKIARP